MQNEIVQVNSVDMIVKEFKGQRVVTFKDIDLVHERTDGTAKRNFNTNKKHFVLGEDYFVRNSSEAKSEFGISAPNGLYLITEQGYLMLVKSFTDDLAWDVQRKLVKSYFGRKRPMSAMEQLQLQRDAIFEINEKVDDVKQDLEDFKNDMPILGVEESRITEAVRKKGVKCLGGKDSNAYKDKSLRGKVYQDIYRELKRQFGVATYKAIKRNQCETAVHIIEVYELPIVLAEQITDCNAQTNMEVA